MVALSNCTRPLINQTTLPRIWIVCHKRHRHKIRILVRLSQQTYCHLCVIHENRNLETPSRWSNTATIALRILLPQYITYNKSISTSLLPTSFHAILQLSCFLGVSMTLDIFCCFTQALVIMQPVSVTCNDAPMESWRQCPIPLCRRAHMHSHTGHWCLSAKHRAVEQEMAAGKLHISKSSPRKAPKILWNSSIPPHARSGSCNCSFFLSCNEQGRNRRQFEQGSLAWDQFDGQRQNGDCRNA